MKFAEQFRRGLNTLTSQRYEKLLIPGGYTFYPVVSKIWKESEKRVLVILESVDRSDLREGKFLNSTRDERQALNNPITNLLPILLDRAHLMANDWRGEDNEVACDFAFGAVNFNASKSRSLSRELVKPKHLEFADRVIKIVRSLRPTHILCCGDTATLNILEALEHKEAPHAYAKRGWVFDIDFGEDVVVKFTPTLDLDSICSPRSASEFDDEDMGSNDDSSALTDLLYFVGRNATNLFLEKNPYSLKGLDAEPRLVNTIKKFDSVMNRVEATDGLIGFDSETLGLETIHNKIYFVQFCIEDGVGYVIPVDHPHESNPFNERERAYIKDRLRTFFGEDRRKHLKTLVTQNGMFDFRVFRSLLNIKFIHHTIHEITAGESLLDENIGLMTRQTAKWYVDGEHMLVSYQNLKNAFCLYENDFYYDESRKINKSNRGALSRLPVDDPDSLLYCAMDVVSIRGMARMQILRAHNTYVRRSVNSERECYGPYYLNHLYRIMQSVVTSISHMEQDGSPVDIKYLRTLMGKESPVLKRLREIEKDFCEFPSVQEAEKRIMGEHGRGTASLFSGFNVNCFSMAKKDHLKTLFFHVMKLAPVSQTDTGADAIDKIFVAEYAADHPEVKMFGEHTKASKLMSTYIKGWYKQLMSSVDSSRDFVLRAGFGFFTIISGRLNSFRPSLQQVPSRGPMAPIIHRMFTAPPGHLGVNADLNAAEVRGASVLSGDKPLAESFAVGQSLRREFMRNPSEEIKKRLKLEGDVHLLNVKRFFNKIVDKSHPLRSAVKAVVFGVLYGKSAKTLGRDLQKEEISSLVEERRKLVKEYRDLKKGLGNDRVSAK
jgi:DNA polymerase I-like protein with 3'-5' exonuclease and polymerase domains